MSTPAPSIDNTPDIPVFCGPGGMRVSDHVFRDMPNPDDAMLASPEFNAIYEQIKNWDVNAPNHYAGYCGLNGSHVAIILNALTAAGLKVVPVEG